MTHPLESDFPDWYRADMKPKPTHGGLRPGAGKKPGPRGTKTPLTVKLSPVVHEFFETLTETRGTFLERITLSSKEFRAFKKNLEKSSDLS